MIQGMLRTQISYQRILKRLAESLERKCSCGCYGRIWASGRVIGRPVVRISNALALTRERVPHYYCMVNCSVWYSTRKGMIGRTEFRLPLSKRSVVLQWTEERPTFVWARARSPAGIRNGQECSND